MRRAASGTGFALAALLSALAMPGQVAATTDSLVISGGGREMFELIFYGKGDGPEPNFLSIRSPTAPEKQNMARGWSVWADVLGPTAKNSAALGVDVTMIDEVGNARCGSDISPLESGLTQLAEGIINGEPIEKRAFMDQGQSMSLGRPTVVPLHSDRGEIYSTAVHEAGHGLGLLTNMRKYKPGERTRFSAMDMHLVSYATGSAVWLRDLTDMEQVVRRDEHGKYFTYRQAVDEHGVHYLSWDVELPEGKPLPSGAFVIGDDSESDVFFQGPETMKTFSAYNAKTSGVRINGFEKMGAAMRPELSHLELAHSMMSHQNYRNYNFFMEVELAVLKDLGYQIDLKRFYGTSIYGDNLDPIDNTTPFYARSADGKSWLYGQPSEETFGIGLHVYGDGNTIVQKADILTRGEAATGMRIDGAGTNLTVPSGVQVRSDGTEGAGLLVAYGRNTKIAVQGTISAKGEGGMAVRFDFGGNCMGDLIEMRGSYIRKVLDNNTQLVDGALEGADKAGFPLYLEGPLVDSFNLAGSLEGRDASIFMSDNAFVKEINILSGASVKGDIVSLWDAKNPLLHQKAPKDSLYTALVFGRKAEADGGTSPDRGFNMILEGSVRGPKGIDMSLEAGSLRVNGEVHVHRLVNHGWLDVRGLGSQQTGTVSDTFTQGDDGVLQSQVTPDGRTTYISAHEGSARGRWAIEPARGYWGSGKAVVLADGPVVFDKGSTSFASALLVPSSSLTLSFSLLDASGQRPVLAASRAASAYSSLATRDSGAAAGRALVLANRGTPSPLFQSLMTEIDFMDSREGIDRALSQLSADAFNERFANALGHQLLLSQRLLARMLQNLPKGTSARSGEAGQTGLAAGDGTESGSGWTAWGSLFGMADNQSAYGSSDGWYSTGCGLMGGMDKDLGGGLAAGFDLALLSDRFEAGGRQDADASSQGVFLGVHGSYAPSSWSGAYLLGAARFGFDVNRMERSVTAGAFHRSHESEWTDWSGAFMLGAGWDWFFGEAKSVRLGPLATLQYAFASHPDFEEDGGAEALRIDGGTADSLAFLLGAHIGASKDVGSACRLEAELMAGWRHELLEGSIRTRAAFAENPSASFTSTRRLNTRDAAVLQASLKLAHDSGWFLALDLGGEARTAGAGVSGGLRGGCEF